MGGSTLEALRHFLYWSFSCSCQIIQALLPLYVQITSSFYSILVLGYFIHNYSFFIIPYSCHPISVLMCRSWLFTSNTDCSNVHTVGSQKSTLKTSPIIFYIMNSTFFILYNQELEVGTKNQILTNILPHSAFHIPYSLDLEVGTLS